MWVGLDLGPRSIWLESLYVFFYASVAQIVDYEIKLGGHFFLIRMEWNGKGLKISEWITCNKVKVLFDETFLFVCYVRCSNAKYIFSLWVKNIWKTLPYYLLFVF